MHTVHPEFILGHTYYLTGRYEEAMAALKRALIRAPDFLPTHAYLAAIYSAKDRCGVGPRGVRLGG
jgi:tetratricopeptide (TPR) repeat protein